MLLQNSSAFNLAELSDQISLVKMDWLTMLGRNILPPGYWGEEGEDGCVKDTTKSHPKSDAKTLYLTFDDGPNPYTTEQLLELLREENVPATFFFIGSHIERFSEIVQLPQMQDHTVGSHSYSHMPMPLLGSKNIEREVVRTNRVIEEVLGTKATLFRPPYGLINQKAADCLSEHQMKLIYWGAVPEDWSVVGSERITARVAQRLAHGKMIVLHEGRLIAKQTIESTRGIVRQAKARGFEFKAL